MLTALLTLKYKSIVDIENMYYIALGCIVKRNSRLEKKFKIRVTQCFTSVAIDFSSPVVINMSGKETLDLPPL